MNKLNYELKLWSYIQSKSTFFDLPIEEVTNLLERDFLIDDGITELKFLFPEIIENDLENEYNERSKLEGAESKIYWKINDDEYIYKLTDPHYKSLYGRFNEVLMYYILQDYLFNDFKYEDLKICGDEMFVRQRATESDIPEMNQIISCMTNAGYDFDDRKIVWMKNIKDISILIEDLNSANCRINENKLEVIDPMIRINYEKL